MIHNCSVLLRTDSNPADVNRFQSYTGKISTLPWFSSRLHVVGNSYILGPYIILPFSKKQDHINITKNIRTLIKRVTAFLMLKQHNINSKSDKKSICFKNFHAKFEIDRAIFKLKLTIRPLR